MTLQIFVNAVIRTQDPKRPWARSMAVSDGRVVALDDEAEALVGTGTEAVDMDGAFLMPGLIDVHNHHSLAGAADLFECNFLPTDDVDTILETVARWSASLEPGAWVIGGSWGSGLFEELSRLDTLARLDEASGGRPVLLKDDSKHNRWVNSAAMALAGIDASTRDPEGGEILRDPATGLPTGVLIEAGGVLVERVVAASQGYSLKQMARACARGIEILHSYGVTAFQDAATSLQIMEALRHLDQSDALAAWVVSSMQVNDFIFGTTPLGEELVSRGEEFRTAHHRPDFIKIFLDGVPPSRTAAFLEPYLPDEHHAHDFAGHTTMPAEDLVGWLRRTAKTGISAKIHCTGDASVRMVLDAVQTIRGEGFHEAKYQIAHGQFVHEDDLPRFAALDVSADISPSLWFPGVIYEAIKTVLPLERATKMQPNRDLLDSGATIGGGSDWPVSVSPNAWEAIQGLITRADPTGQFPGTLWPEQAITLEEALACYTTAPARMLGLSDQLGTLEPGKAADFILLDRNPFEVEHSALAKIQTLQTWFAGKRVFQRA
ncbi:amidohydrolase [Arthrobacter sp. AZCC_0090]|uniref:amidohydrolase n=1 Tax=Arthrobacter sp. AZCC_0090 TaxID=2735881 RepID=UPI00160CC42E|nr:amidohydrolase [Arthrobacter sp. AZCC_0090]MBB6405654.1 hypothetical protein [Arthrobacter sp. AZCC_0090]